MSAGEGVAVSAGEGVAVSAGEGVAVSAGEGVASLVTDARDLGRPPASFWGARRLFIMLIENCRNAIDLACNNLATNGCHNARRPRAGPADPVCATAMRSCQPDVCPPACRDATGRRSANVESWSGVERPMPLYRFSSQQWRSEGGAGVLVSQPHT